MVNQIQKAFILIIGTILFVCALWLYKKLLFKYNIYSASPYIHKSSEQRKGVKGNYTWMIHAYVPDHNAGSELMAHAMNLYLTREKHRDVSIIVNKTTVSKWDGISILTKKEMNKIQPVLEDSQLFFTHHTMEPNAVQTAVLLKKPILVLLHDDGRYKYLSEYKKIMPEGNLYCIANSEWLKKYYASLALPTFVLYPPVDWRDYQSSSSREFITLINVNKNKGSDTFIEIAKLLPEYKFLGVKGAYNKQYVDKSVPNITYIENRPNVKEIYSRTDILLMPSKSESWGRTAIEAMSSGIPVLAHPTPGLVESCGEAGILCKRDSPEEWVREIRRLKTDEAYYKAKSEACLRRARELDPEPQLEAMAKWLEGIEWKK